jgi:Ca2+-binding RTX toxin-like protein
MVDNLTVKATAHSTDLNLTLATHLVDGTVIAGGGVHHVTLADYAPGHGSNVDVTGNGVDNVITGNSGDNVITGGLGADILNGGAGNDTFRYVLGEGLDEIDGGAGSDTLDYTVTASAVSVNLGLVTPTATGLASLSGIENVTGGSAGDTLIGNADANTLTGADGADTLDGKEGTDTAVYAATLAQSALTASLAIGR